MFKINREVSRCVLTIGPDYKYHRGGIGAIIAVYSENYEKFNFIPTYKVGSFHSRLFIFIHSIFRFIQTLILNGDIKLIHIHGASNSSFYRKLIFILIGKLIFSKKIIYHIHGGGFMEFYFGNGELNKKIVSRIVDSVDCVLCLSESWKDFFNTNFQTKKLYAINNVIPNPLIRESKLRVENKELILLFLGKVCVEKGVFDLVNVIGENIAKYRGKLRVLIGGNGDVVKLNNLIKAAKVEHCVEYVGWITEEQKPMFFKLCDAFVLPSYTEGMPVSILEAMSYGKPIIATPIGGIPEIVLPFVNGLLFHPGDMLGLKVALDYFIENRDQLLLFGENSANMANQFKPNEVFLRLNSIYDELLVKR